MSARMPTDSENEILYWFRLFKGEWLSQRRIYDLLLRKAGVGGTLSRMKRKGLLISRKAQTDERAWHGGFYNETQWFAIWDEAEQAEHRRRMAIRALLPLIRCMAKNREDSLAGREPTRLWKCRDGTLRKVGIIGYRHVHPAPPWLH
jgi:hypothetical protein